MKKLSTPIRYSIVLVVMLMAISASYGGYEIYKHQKAEREKWSVVSHEFKNCEMFYALETMGYSSRVADLYQNPFGRADWYSTLRAPLVELMTTGVLDKTIMGLDQIWLDPNSVGVLGTEPASETSLNFLQQCKESIEDGQLKVWLDVGIYYLVIGQRNRAIEWLNTAAEQNIPDAYVLLGHAYRNGLLTGVKDEGSALINYTQAAEAGSVKGMLNVADMVIEVDPESALHYLHRAARQGSLTATYRLAQLADTSVGSRTQKASVGYFWTLVFHALQNSTPSKSLQDMADQIIQARIAPFLVEHDTEYPLDGVPSKPWNGFKSSVLGSKTVIQNYDKQQAVIMLQRYENALSPLERVQIQGQVKEWINRFRTDKGADTP